MSFTFLFFVVPLFTNVPCIHYFLNTGLMYFLGVVNSTRFPNLSVRWFMYVKSSWIFYESQKSATLWI